jgi:hypothetical protein
MAGIDAMKGIGKLSPQGVNKIADGFRADGLTASAMADLKNQLGTKLQPLFDLDEREVKMLNAMPPESVETLFHVCTRAVTSGGKVEYERFETGEPKMQIGYTEYIDHKPAGGGPPKAVGHAKITCFK